MKIYNLFNELRRLRFFSGKRKRALNYKEKDLIYDLKDAEDDLIIQCGIAILLDNKSDYERFFSKLSENEKNAFKEFPIYNLLDKEDI